MGSECIWCFVNMLAKKCLLLVSDVFLLTSRFNFLWSNGIFLREFRAGKQPSCLLFSFMSTKADWGHSSLHPKWYWLWADPFCWPCRHFRRRHSSAWFAFQWLVALSVWSLMLVVGALRLLCTAESIWQVIDTEKTCISLEMFCASRVD